PPPRRQRTLRAILEPTAIGDAMSSSTYLLAGQVSELERLKLQSRGWEPSGRRLLETLGGGGGAWAVGMGGGGGPVAVDIGCGAIGWLRLLSEWVGPDGEVVGTDIDEAMLTAAKEFVAEERLANVVLVKDDPFDSKLEASSFDLVHSRFEITPLARGDEQMATYGRLARSGGIVALEDWDKGSWHFN